MDTHQGEDGRLWNSPLRKKLASRHKQFVRMEGDVAIVKPKSSPSQRRSENAHKKERKRAGTESEATTYPSDCRGCKRECNCSHDLEQCDERSVVLRCRKCGQKVRFRVITGVAWEYCPVCSGGV